MKYKKGEHLFICGMTRTGKSYALIHLIKKHLKTDFIIIDEKREDFKNLGCEVVKNYSQFLKALQNKKRKILIQDDAISENLNKYCKFLYENCKNFTLVIDELHSFVTKHKIPSYLKKILHIGASSQKAFWGASQRTADIHNSVLSQSLHLLAFNMRLLSDRKKISEEMNLNENNYNFNNLKQYNFFYLHAVNGAKPQIMKF
jgi:hypothetical protein